MTLAWGNKKKPSKIENLSQNEFISELFEKSLVITSKMASVVGVNDEDLLPSILDWKSETPHYLVGGPSQSGRTSLLHTFVLGLAHQYPPEKLHIVLIDGSRSLDKLRDLPHVLDWVTEDEGLVKNIANLQNELLYRRSQPEKSRNLPEMLFVMDDYDLTCEAFGINDVILSKLGKHVRQDSGLGFHFLISALPENMANAGPLIKQIRLTRSGISLVNADTLENLGGRATSMMRREELPQGRGYFFARSKVKLIQFANPNGLAYSQIIEKWKKSKKAEWNRTATSEQIEQVRKESESPQRASDVQSSSVQSTRTSINSEMALQGYLKQQQEQKKGGKS